MRACGVRAAVWRARHSVLHARVLRGRRQEADGAAEELADARGEFQPALEEEGQQVDEGEEGRAPPTRRPPHESPGPRPINSKNVRCRFRRFQCRKPALNLSMIESQKRFEIFEASHILA